MQAKRLSLAIIAALPTMMCAQTPTAHSVPQSPPAHDAVYITAEEVKAVQKFEDTAATMDQTLKDVNIGKLNVSVAVIHRAGPLKESLDGSVSILAHHEQTEVFLIIGGSGTMATGGTIYDAHETPTTAYMYTTLNGPTASGKIKKGDGHRQVVHVGDIVVIPPDVAHGWEQIDEHVEYLSVRPDPDRALPSGYVNPILNGKPPDLAPGKGLDTPDPVTKSKPSGANH